MTPSHDTKQFKGNGFLKGKLPSNYVTINMKRKSALFKGSPGFSGCPRLRIMPPVSCSRAPGNFVGTRAHVGKLLVSEHIRPRGRVWYIGGSACILIWRRKKRDLENLTGARYFVGGPRCIFDVIYVGACRDHVSAWYNNGGALERYTEEVLWYNWQCKCVKRKMGKHASVVCKPAYSR